MLFSVSEPTTLVELLQRHFSGASITTFRKWLRHGQLFIDAQPADRIDVELKEGQWVEYRKPVHMLWDQVPVVYEDDDLIVLDKPAGMLSVDREKPTGEDLFSLLKVHYGSDNVYVIHRLDKETSGLIVFAKSERGFQALKSQLEEREIHRRYLALVTGKFEEKDGFWESYLEEGPRFVRAVSESHPRGEWALSFYRVLEEGAQLSLVEVEIHTGKKTPDSRASF